MKKFALSLLICLLAVTCFACGRVPDGQYWLDAQSDLYATYNGEEYNKLYNLKFSENVEYLAKEGKSEDYDELTEIYGKVLNACLTFNVGSFNILAIVPNNNNSTFYNHLTTLVQKSKDFETDIKAFIEKKDEFESKLQVRVNTYGKDYILTDSISKNDLLLFKRDYLALIKKAYELTDAFQNVYSEGYVNLKTLKLTEETKSLSYDLYKTLSVATANVQTTKVAIAIIEEYNCRAEIKTLKNFFTVQNNFYNKYKIDTTYSSSENDYSNCKKWLAVYNSYLNEQSTFFNMLNSVDLLSLARDYNNKVKDYAGSDSEKFEACRYISNFSDVNSYFIETTFQFAGI